MKPLPKKSRFISLALLFLLFLVITPLLVFYSLGYRFSDIDDVLTLEKTGGVYIHSNVSNTEVYLDGEFIKNNGVLLRNTLIQNLKPSVEHKIEVHKDGYQSWIKTLFVYSSLVTEGRVLMIPKEIPERKIYPFIDTQGLGTTTAPIKTPLLKGKPVPNNLEYKNIMNSFEGKDVYSVATSSLVKTQTATSTKTEIPKHFVKLGISDPKNLKNLIENGDEVSWLEDGNIVLNWVGDNVEIPYYYCLEPENCRSKIILDWSDDIKKFAFLPGRGDVFLVLVDSGLYAVEVDDRSDRNIQTVYSKKVSDFVIGANNKIFVREGDNFYELTI